MTAAQKNIPALLRRLSRVRPGALTLCALWALSPAAAQAQKKPLTHDVYDLWNKITGTALANNGRWVAYTLEPGEGDPQLVFVNADDGRSDTVARGAAAAFSDDSRFAVFFVKPVYAEIRKARIAGKSGDDLPKDTLGIYEPATRSLQLFPRVKSFKLPEKGAAWVAYLREKEPSPPDTAAKKGKGDPDAGDADERGADKKKEEKGTTLTARELASGREFLFPWTTDYAFSKNGRLLVITASGNDSSARPAVVAFDTRRQTTDTLAAGGRRYLQPAADEAGEQAAFLADRDTSRAKLRRVAACRWRSGRGQALLVADTLTPGMRKGWAVSEHLRPWFSKDGRRLFCGTAPAPAPDDTTLLEAETATLDVWHWQDPYPQPQQLKDLEQELKRSYLAVVHPDGGFVQLGAPDLPSVTPGDEGNAPMALGLSDLPYRRSQSWESLGRTDAEAVDVRTGARIPVMKGLEASPALSPGARYVYWYDQRARHWFTWSARTKATVRASASVGVPLYDEQSDVPDLPGPHGAMGWTEGDGELLVYDRFDVWRLDPAGGRAATNLTAGDGRRRSLRYRYVRLDPEERFIPGEGELLFRTFDERDKSGGYAAMPLRGAGPPRQLVRSAHEYGVPVKARDAGAVVFTRSRFEEFPDLLLADLSFGTPRRISNANPWQAEYRWGTAEPVRWLSSAGVPLEGILVKPEGFDRTRRYPMIVYYYERFSDQLHRHWVPAPSRSSINPTMFASNGYLVFYPDIRYETGRPGRSAVDCVVSGVLHILAQGFVDSAHIGIQGQSWGGYQTAYIVTQTPMFAAAMAGAPVANMTSAYGGIRWESGLSRMWQYERRQSRIGGSLWERPLLYLENSPLFHLEQVRTPLLIMHNDGDGAVPWQQGIELFMGLRRLDRPAWLLCYNGEEHNLRQRKNMKDISVRMMQFFDHYLKGAPAPVWMTRGIPAARKGKTLGYETHAE